MAQSIDVRKALGRQDQASPGGLSLPRVLANVKETIKDYKLAEQRPLALPGNVPATVFVGTCFGGGSTLVTIVAIDGTRLVNVTVGGRTGGGEFLAQAGKIVRSLRVFEPDLTAEE